jgi:hypothetical protein
MWHRDLRDLEATEPLRQYFSYYSLFCFGKSATKRKSSMLWLHKHLCAFVSLSRLFACYLQYLKPLNIFGILVFLVFWFYLHWWDISCRNGHLQNSLQCRYFCYFIQWSVSYCLFHQSAISTHCVSTTEACSCKALYPLPFLKKKSFFPFIVFITF